MKRLSTIVIVGLAFATLRLSAFEVEPGAERCVPVVSEILTGRCVSIADGDTIGVLVDKRMVSLRLEGIDAPERRQDHSTKATEALRDLVEGKSVEVHVTGEDRYRRTLAIVKVAGENVNERMLADGWCWQYVEYNCDPAWAALEETARTEKRGLWAHENLVAPWEFRRLERQRRQVARGQRQGLTAEPTPATETAPAAEAEVDKSLGYWLNTSSNVRHNSSCRNFQNTKRGRACSKSDGKACGICGG